MEATVTIGCMAAVGIMMIASARLMHDEERRIRSWIDDTFGKEKRGQPAISVCGSRTQAQARLIAAVSNKPSAGSRAL